MTSRGRFPRRASSAHTRLRRGRLRRVASIIAVIVGLSFLLPAGAQTLAAPLNVSPNPVRAGQTVSVVAAVSRQSLGCENVEIITTAILPRGDETIRSFGPGGFGLADGRFVPFPVASFDGSGLLRATFTLSPTLRPGNYPVTVGRACGGTPASLFVSTSFAVLGANSAPAGPAAPSLYVPTSPFRLFDTRTGAGGIAATKVVGNTMFEVQIAGRGNPAIPANATAVVLNLTYVDAEGSGFVTAWPSGEDFPGVSNLNKVGAGPTPNGATVKLGAGGRISIFNQGSATHLLGDVAGYYVPADSSLPPSSTTSTTTPSTTPSTAPSTTVPSTAPSTFATVGVTTTTAGTPPASVAPTTTTTTAGADPASEPAPLDGTNRPATTTSAAPTQTSGTADVD